MSLLLTDFIYSRDCKLNLRKTVDTTRIPPFPVIRPSGKPMWAGLAEGLLSVDKALRSGLYCKVTDF